VTTIPRWRGFNIIDLFSTSVRWRECFPLDPDGLVTEDDFAMIRDLGFNFVRLPVSYLFFGKGPFGRVPDEDRLWLIDRVVEFGQEYEVHVMLNLHRAPGFCVLAGSYFDFPEWGNLFTEDEALRDYVTWWVAFAERYRGVPASALSFDLLNEPLNLDDDVFDRTFIPAIEAIHTIDPERLVHVEGCFTLTAAGNVAVTPPTKSVVDMPNVISSMHLYHPPGLTMYKAPWSPGAFDFEAPTWPHKPTLRADVAQRELTGDNAKVWDKDAIRELLAPYLEIAEAGHPVHIGEMGAYSAVDHDVYLAYLTDVIDLLNEYGIGYAMWNFRGPYGVLDNGRTDAGYEEYRGHKLDRKLLDVLVRV
jgi:endoglucanase